MAHRLWTRAEGGPPGAPARPCHHAKRTTHRHRRAPPPPLSRRRASGHAHPQPTGLRSHRAGRHWMQRRHAASRLRHRLRARAAAHTHATPRRQPVPTVGGLSARATIPHRALRAAPAAVLHPCRSTWKLCMARALPTLVVTRRPRCASRWPSASAPPTGRPRGLTDRHRQLRQGRRRARRSEPLD